jgi:hypothetical protein
MKSSPVSAATNATAAQYNDLRSDAYGGSQLLVHQQASPGLTVHVENGVLFLGGTKVTYAGGNSAAFVAPVTNPRIDILTIDSSGTLAITQGTENASPVAPTYPIDKMVLCEVRNVVGETIIYDNANQVAGQGYITDVRPVLYNPSPSITDNSALALNTLYTNTSGRAQLHIASVDMTVSAGGTGNARVDFQVAGVMADQALISKTSGTEGIEMVLSVMVMVLPGQTYKLFPVVNGNGAVNSIVSWKTISY